MVIIFSGLLGFQFYSDGIMQMMSHWPYSAFIPVIILKTAVDKLQRTFTCHAVYHKLHFRLCRFLDYAKFV